MRSVPELPPGSQVHGTTVCDTLLPHSRPRPILPAAKRVLFRDAVPPHAPLASPVWDPGSSARMPQNALPSVPSSPTPLRCTSLERPCLARGDCYPPGKGCNRAGPSSRDEAGVLQPLLHHTQKRWWPSTNPGSASLELGTPHVIACPPSPPLESHAAQITARCPHPREAQSCGRCTLTTAHVPRRMATPSRDDPADLESIRGSSGGPVCFP